jgi:hypothetical protein
LPILAAIRRASQSARRHVACHENSRGVTRPSLQHQRAGYEGQVSIPEQNETVNELAGPSQHLLPATSKLSSGRSSLNTSSSLTAISDSLMGFGPLFATTPKRSSVLLVPGGAGSVTVGAGATGAASVKKAKIASPPTPTTKRIEHRSLGARSGEPLRR